MKNNIIGLTITLAVGILLIGSLLAPTISGITDEKKTYYNEGIPYALTDSESAETHTIVSTIVDNVPILTFDGETIDTSYFDSQFTIVFGEHSIFRYNKTNGTVLYSGTYVEGADTAVSRAFTTATDITITITGTTAQISGIVSGNSVTYDVYDKLAYICPDGDYRYCTNPCVLADSRIIGGGITYSPFSGQTVICFDGTAEGVTAGVYYPLTTTIGDVTINTSTVVSNLLRIDSIEIDATESGDTEPKTATYTYFLAPYEIVYDNPDYIGSAAAALLTPIIIILLAALVIGATQVFRRD